MAKETAPAVPDPNVTASAQTASNVDTAKAQATLNNTNQVTPYGNLTYTTNGTDANGVPSYTATQTLSPAEQQLLNTTQGTQQSLATTASSEASKLPSLLDTPLDLSSANLDAYTNSHFLDPFNQQSDQDQAKLETQLANQGIQIGSSAYTNAMNDFNTQKSNNLNSMLGTSQANAQSAILAQRETPLNEIIGLAGGTQIAQPSYTSTPQTSVGGTDVAGITSNAYNQQVANVNAANQQTQSLLGGLFGLGGSLIGLSDKRVKENIEKVGELPDDTNVYEYDFKPGLGLPEGRQVGVIAQEIEKSNPGAVVRTSDGLKAVDYSKVLADAIMKRRAA